MGLFGLFGKKENKVFSKEINVNFSNENNSAEISGNIQLYNLTRIEGFYNHHEDGKFINEEHVPLLENEIDYMIKFIDSFKGKIFYNRHEATQKVIQKSLKSNVKDRPDIFLNFYVKVTNRPFTVSYTKENVPIKLRYHFENEPEIEITDVDEIKRILKEHKKIIKDKD
jgi:hypothetical protein